MESALGNALKQQETTPTVPVFDLYAYCPRINYTSFLVAQILDNSRLSPPKAFSYNLNFSNTFDAGESYPEQEHRAWLTEAGFVDIERVKLFLPDSHGLMTARKPD